MAKLKCFSLNLPISEVFDDDLAGDARGDGYKQKLS